MKWQAAIFIVIGTVVCANAEDYWSNCEEGYRFCSNRPYYRNCAIWTKWKEPLFLNGTVCPLPTPLPRKDPRK